MSPDTILEKIFRLTPLQKSGLAKLGITTTSDLLLYLPNRYQASGDIKTIAELVKGDQATIVGRVVQTKITKAWRKKIPLAEATIEDETGKIKAIWFHQPYLAKKISEGMTVELSGKVAERKETLYLANPDIATGDFTKRAQSLFNKGGKSSLIPVYSETRAISSGWLYYHIQKLLAEKVHQTMSDPLPETIRQKYNLPSLSTALVWIHAPQKISDTEAARKRFAFEEIFLIQLSRLKIRSDYHETKAFSIKTNSKDIDDFTDRFPFPLTSAQKKSIATITIDLAKNDPMMRLLEGDVGSGKTAVAATSAYATVRAGFEAAYMVPTEILAKQHFESFIQYFAHLGVSVGLITGSECRKFPSKINPHEHTHISRAQLLKWVADGQIPILVGTHSLIQKTVQFRNLALVIIDEQHRFGIMQRAKLLKKNGNQLPHLLSMTATPIPRTLALTLYGDLDLTLLDEMPAGRRPIITDVIPPDKREEMYAKIRVELSAGRQVYVICPRIDEPDPDKALALNVKSAKSEQKRLQKNIFPDYRVGLLHSKLRPADKEKTMQEFAAGHINILVATSVVEVGVNVPNATVIIIEGAERFGLAQLHQLRGRVIRSNHQAYCFILSDTKTDTSLKRLTALTKTKNGFELAELDLALRGSGSLAAGKQWGISDIGMEAIKNIKMVEAARTEASNIIAADPELAKFPILQQKISQDKKDIHFE